MSSGRTTVAILGAALFVAGAWFLGMQRNPDEPTPEDVAPTNGRSPGGLTPLGARGRPRGSS
jgi:hypothetical protein